MCVLTNADLNLRLPRTLFSGAERGKWERTFDAQELSEIIDKDITCTDVVDNERNAFFRSSHRKTETRERLRRAGRMTRFALSNLISVSSCGIETRVRGYELVELNASPPVA